METTSNRIQAPSPRWLLSDSFDQQKKEPALKRKGKVVGKREKDEEQESQPKFKKWEIGRERPKHFFVNGFVSLLSLSLSLLERDTTTAHWFKLVALSEYYLF